MSDNPYNILYISTNTTLEALRIRNTLFRRLDDYLKFNVRLNSLISHFTVLKNRIKFLPGPTINKVGVINSIHRTYLKSSSHHPIASSTPCQFEGENATCKATKPRSCSHRFHHEPSSTT